MAEPYDGHPWDDWPTHAKPRAHHWIVRDDGGYRCDRCGLVRRVESKRPGKRRRFSYAVPGWGPLRGVLVAVLKMPPCRPTTPTGAPEADDDDK
jgi:hypothetical protein